MANMKNELSNLLPKNHQYNRFVEVWVAVFKLRYGWHSKKFEIHWFSHVIVSGWSLFLNPLVYKCQNPIYWEKIQFHFILVTRALSRKQIASYL